MKNAQYRKINDRSLNSSKYHKLDGTNVKAKLKEATKKEVKSAMEEEDRDTQKQVK